MNKLFWNSYQLEKRTNVIEISPVINSLPYVTGNIVAGKDNLRGTLSFSFHTVKHIIFEKKKKNLTVLWPYLGHIIRTKIIPFNYLYGPNTSEISFIHKFEHIFGVLV